MEAITVVKDRISIRDLAARVMQVVERETGVVRDQLRRNGIDLLWRDPPNSSTPTRWKFRDRPKRMYSMLNNPHRCVTRPLDPPTFLRARNYHADPHAFSRWMKIRARIDYRCAAIGQEYASMLVPWVWSPRCIEQRPVSWNL